MTTPDPQQDNNLRRFYSHLSDAALEEANESLRQYVALALRVFERIEHDPEAWARFEALTASRRNSRIEPEGPQTNPPTVP